VFGKPTGINNVETLVNVLEVLTLGGEAYAKIGTADSTGPGCSACPDVSSGPACTRSSTASRSASCSRWPAACGAARRLKAILLGWRRGIVRHADDLDLRLTFEDSKAAGSRSGRGRDGVRRGRGPRRHRAADRVVLPRRVVRAVRPVPGGTVRQEEALARVIQGRANGSLTDELALIGEIGQVMRDASICGLGQLAANAVDSAIHRLKIFDGGAA
jgi:NADH-quinone oxidoreductase subunit F